MWSVYEVFTLKTKFIAYGLPGNPHGGWEYGWKDRRKNKFKRKYHVAYKLRLPGNDNGSYFRVPIMNRRVKKNEGFRLIDSSEKHDDKNSGCIYWKEKWENVRFVLIWCAKKKGKTEEQIG